MVVDRERARAAPVVLRPEDDLDGPSGGGDGDPGPEPLRGRPDGEPLDAVRAGEGASRRGGGGAELRQGDVRQPAAEPQPGAAWVNSPAATAAIPARAASRVETSVRSSRPRAAKAGAVPSASPASVAAPPSAEPEPTATTSMPIVTPQGTKIVAMPSAAARARPGERAPPPGEPAPPPSGARPRGAPSVSAGHRGALPGGALPGGGMSSGALPGGALSGGGMSGGALSGEALSGGALFICVRSCAGPPSAHEHARGSPSAVPGSACAHRRRRSIRTASTTTAVPAATSSAARVRGPTCTAAPSSPSSAPRAVWAASLPVRNAATGGRPRARP